jgi:polyferredoxin
MIAAWMVLTPVAAAMAATTAFLVKWAAEARTPLRASTVVFLLLMMVGMVGGAAVYYLAPSTSSLVAGLWVASGVMSVSVVTVFLAFLQEVQAKLRGVAKSGPPALRNPSAFVAAVIVLVVANELLMGWTFQAASGLGVAGGWSAHGFLSWLVGSVDSPWFLFTMSGEMVLTSYLLRDRLSRPVLFVLVSQSIIMWLSPPALSFGAWVALSSYAASAVMIVLFIFLLEHLYRHPQLTVGFSRYLVRLLAIYSLMMAGLFLWLYYGDGTAFAVSILVEMGVFFAAVVRPERLAGPVAEPWLARARWAFTVLSGIFVTEIFMGAVLDVQIDPGTFLGAFGTYSVSGPPLVALENAVLNGFWFLATVAASTWFLVMMGFEMGALVAFKFKETRHLENRVRLLLMMGCYAAFAVFYPSVYFGLLAPNAPNPSTVPVLGWSMGVGSYPLATTVFVVVLLTYLITGSLVVLFGRRVICSAFCTAPLMYQGTAIDTMKAFNRSSPVARKYLSSRLSKAYSLTAGLVMGTLVITSFVSYLDTTGALNVLISGTDPTVFFFALYFSVLWYVLFVTIPYTGNYNCVTMGWCYTGLIAQAFHKIGFYRLKVRSRQVCRDCTTLDCAKGCPVGLVDMPGHFRTKGEFRSSKCCGVGDCIEACPYDNLYIYDVRHWVRERFGLPTRPKPVVLPMVRARPASALPVSGLVTASETAAERSF